MGMNSEKKVDPGPRVVGKMVVELLEGDTFRVRFPILGLFTHGRLEAALPFLYRELTLARAAEQRVAQGRPREFNMGGVE